MMFNKKKIIILFFIILCNISSCIVKDYKYTIIKENNYIVYDFDFFNNSEIIIPKNQTSAQSLSIVIKNNSNELIIFDGGRKEDAEILKKIINENGNIVSAWFLTHIHDDHIGAIYEILNDENIDINIKNIFYNFADFSWYQEKIGDDAGFLLMFYEALNKYKNKFARLNINNNIQKNDIYKFSNVKIDVLNNIYLLNSDPINNSSITYRATIDDKTLLILGDLGYYGGEKLIYDNADKIAEIDIVALAHHGQDGIPIYIYGLIDPKIVIWPTSKTIYENLEKKFDTDETKNHLSNLNVKLNILSYLETSVIR